jgi:hypothetical protein
MEIKKANKELKDVITYVEKLPPDATDGTYRHYNGNLIKIPTLDQLKKASSKWCWAQADEAYTNHLTELDNQRREDNYDGSIDKIDNILDDMLDLAEDNVEELRSSDYKTSTKVQLNYSLARTMDLIIKNKRLNHGRPTRISKSDVDVDTKIEFDGVDNLIGAFHASKKEWTKHKQSK